MNILCLFIILLNLQVGKSQFFQLFEDGTYDFNYHTSGGQHRSEVRYADGTILGKYAYVTPLGEKIDVEYSAGVNGYQEKRKVSKIGIKKETSKSKTQTYQPSFSYGHAPFTPNALEQAQILVSRNKLPVSVSRPNVADSKSSQSNRNKLKFEARSDDDLFWIPSVVNKPNMFLRPIWKKPSLTTERYNETKHQDKLKTTVNKPIFEEKIKSKPTSGFIIRQPLRRPVPLLFTATTEMPFDVDRMDNTPYFKMTAPLNRISNVFVKPIGSSGVVNVRFLK